MQCIANMRLIFGAVNQEYFFKLLVYFEIYKTPEREGILLNVAVIEDEMVYADYLEQLILQWAEGKGEIKVSVFLTSMNFFDKQSSILDYDIIFIDIGLKYSDGIAVAERVRAAGYKNILIFTADFDNRAIDGYRVNAYRYYLKPIKPCDIKECMDYALNKKVNEYFQYTYRGITSRVAFDEIICFESMQHYIDIHTVKATLCMKGALKDIQKQCPACFVRCHKSYIINTNYIVERQGKQLKLQNNRIVDISSRYSEVITSIMKIASQTS